MSPLLANERDGCAASADYTDITDVAHLTQELRLAVDTARRRGRCEQAAALVDLHNRVRDIAVRLTRKPPGLPPFGVLPKAAELLNQALGGRHLAGSDR